MALSIVQIIKHQMIDELVNNKLKQMWEKKSYPGNGLVDLRKTTRKVDQSSWSLGQDLNLAPPGHKNNN
jgi:hypothetical protein